MDQKITKNPAAKTDPAGGGATRDDRPGSSSEVGGEVPALREGAADDFPIVDPDTPEGMGTESVTAHPEARDPDDPGQGTVNIGASS